MTPTISSLPVLVLDVYSRCNCRCVMCDIWRRETARELSLDALIEQLPAIERLQVKWVVFTGGEPLMHPNLFRLCVPLKERGIRLTLLTTGLLLSRYADEVVRDFDDVIVSLDGPPEVHNRIRRVATAFERLSFGVGALRQRKQDFPVAARTTVQHENCAHLCATVDTARELGCDSVSFLAADTHSPAFDHQHKPADRLREIQPDAEGLEALSSEVERLIASGECGRFISETPEKLRRIVDHARWSSGIGEPKAPRCNAPWVSAVWEASGVVRPCFFHPPIGQITKENTLDRVLNAPEATSFRGSLDVATNPVCRRCVCSLYFK